jgi:copper chaperone CopZ
METLMLDVPTMFGDHHVVEVRRILLEMPGVQDVYASSSFQVVEVTFDPKKVGAEAVREALDQAGYLGELALPAETAAPANEPNGSQVYYRHTASYEQTRQVVGFAQQVSYSGRPLWPCPGMGVIPTTSEEA